MFVPVVGATYLDSASGVEIGATLSSGGFSKDQYRPSWQNDAVEGYFNSVTYQANIPHESFEKNGRAYPDVSAFGQNVKVVTSGTASGVSGTSCSAPIFAGIISLLNNELLKRGRAPMGWINPWIYANPQMFTDITAGSNPYQKCDGFVAAKGWVSDIRG
jgi:tripeptidyl-peptidase-1